MGPKAPSEGPEGDEQLDGRFWNSYAQAGLPLKCVACSGNPNESLRGSHQYGRWLYVSLPVTSHISSHRKQSEPNRNMTLPHGS